MNSPSRMNFNKSSRISRESSVVYNCRLLETRTCGSCRKKTCLRTAYPHDPVRPSIQTCTVSSGSLFYNRRQFNKLQMLNIEICRDRCGFLREMCFSHERIIVRVASYGEPEMSKLLNTPIVQREIYTRRIFFFEGD